jgi:Ni/Co efflux regulator RcnB
MTRTLSISLGAAVALICLGGLAAAQQEGGHRPRTGPVQRPAGHGEAHTGPRGYARVAEPRGWDARPPTVDRDTYQRNYQASRSYHIGPYHRPRGWRSHRWVHGEILPRIYFAPEYLIGDYWLFGLEVAPIGYEWVRDDDDALLVNIGTGEVLQVEYGVFS